MLRPYLTLTLLALTASLTACGGHSPSPPQDIARRPSETQLQPSRPLQSTPTTAPVPIAPSSSLPANGTAVKPSVSTKPPVIEPEPDRSVVPLSNNRPSGNTSSSDTASAPEKPSATAPSASVFPEINSIKFDADEYLSSIADPNPALEQAIRQEMPDYKGEMPDGFEVRYSYNQVDLDGDAVPEVLVYLSGYYTCGSGGCTMMVFKQQNQSEPAYQLVSRIRLVNAPVLVSSKATAGWQDLILYVAGGGAEPHYALLQYDGKGYPTNPSIAPEVPAAAVVKGTAILTDGIEPEDGALLEPAQS